MAENDKFSEWFYKNFDIGADKQINKEPFTEIIKNSPIKGVKIKDELARLKIGYKYESQKEQYKKTENGDKAKKIQRVLDWIFYKG